MARRYVTYPEGTPRRQLQDAVDEAFPGHLTAFFDAIAAELRITRKSAGGTFYAFLRGERGLPDAHRAAYLSLTNVDETVLDDVDALRDRPATPQRRDRLEALEGEVVDLRSALDAARKAHSLLLARVRALEKAGRLQTPARTDRPATPRKANGR